MEYHRQPTQLHSLAGVKYCTHTLTLTRTRTRTDNILLLCVKGKLFCGSFYESSPFVVALGGKKQLKFVNTLQFDAVREIFGKYAPQSSQEVTMGEKEK